VNAAMHVLSQVTAMADLLADAEIATAKTLGTGCPALAVDPPLRSGIVLLETEGGRVRDVSPAQTRDAFQQAGVALTVYPGGRARLSVPHAPWRDGDLGRLRSALARCS